MSLFTSLTFLTEVDSLEFTHAISVDYNIDTDLGSLHLEDFSLTHMCDFK